MFIAQRIVTAPGFVPKSRAILFFNFSRISARLVFVLRSQMTVSARPKQLYIALQLYNLNFVYEFESLADQPERLTMELPKIQRIS